MSMAALPPGCLLAASPLFSWSCWQTYWQQSISSQSIQMASHSWKCDMTAMAQVAMCECLPIHDRRCGGTRHTMHSNELMRPVHLSGLAAAAAGRRAAVVLQAGPGAARHHGARSPGAHPQPEVLQRTPPSVQKACSVECCRTGISDDRPRSVLVNMSAAGWSAAADVQ
jgi:hypothetical protein